MEKDKPIKLTVKEELFAQNYIKTGNASEAYRRSYNAKNMTPKTIIERASVLLKKNNIATRVKELQEKLEHKHDISKDRILNELNCYLNADIRDYVDFDGDEPTARVIGADGKVDEKLTLDDLTKELVANKEYADIIIASKASGGAAKTTQNGGGAANNPGHNGQETADYASMKPSDLAAAMKEKVEARKSANQ